MKRAALSVALGASMFANANAADSCRDIQYHSLAQPVIYCPAAMLCEIVLDRDEHVHRAYSSQAGQWEPNVAMEGDPGAMRPSLVIKPEAENLMANFMVFTNRRTYHFIVKSIPESQDRVCITRFLYDDERRAWKIAHRPVHSAQFFPAPSPSATPLSPQAQLEKQLADAVAYTESHGDQYGTDPQPDDYRIVRVAHSADHTYIQLAQMATTPSTVPQLVDTEIGPKIVEYRYDPALRVYAIDNVSREYTLTVPDPKKKGKTLSVRVQLQHRDVARRGR